MWRMDSLSVGISILFGQKTELPRLHTVSGGRLVVVPAHDLAIPIGWKR
jgi:hypothetical protein